MYSVVAKQSAVQLYMCDSPAVFDELQTQTRYQHAWLLSAQLELQLPEFMHSWSGCSGMLAG